MVNDDMKNILFMSPCKYTFLGLSELMSAIPEHAVQLTPVSTPNNIFDFIHKGFFPSAIVVDLSVSERTVLAQSIWFLWNLSVLYAEKKIPEIIPCILLGDNTLPEGTNYPFVWVSPFLSKEILQKNFLKILNNPIIYTRKTYRLKRLSDNERIVINNVLQGFSVKDIAGTMQITAKRVFSFRRNALKKIGLRNRNEYSLLIGKSFL